MWVSDWSDCCVVVVGSHVIYFFIVEKPEFGTIKAKCPETKVVGDYTLCRKDGHYTDHRRPDNIELANIEADLSRRDFTMNAIAKLVQSSNDNDDTTVKYLDPFGGRIDIENKLIRCVGCAKDRLSEDPLRGLRAIRFMVTKNFVIHDDIWNAISNPNFLVNFRLLSKERIQVELHKMFQYNTAKSLQVLHQLHNCQPGLVDYIFNETGLWLMPTLRSGAKPRSERSRQK